MEDIDFFFKIVVRNFLKIQKLGLEGKLVEVTFVVSTCVTLVITDK